MSKTVERKVNVTVTYVGDVCGRDPIFGVYEYLIAQKQKDLTQNVNAGTDRSWTEVATETFEEGIANGEAM
ncbi:hypothetical protein [Alicyclobacillus sp. SO9]|uniref:hypothetical protein n=1 Tax=Alicyclobacillus sp. SO9 TaxID=2665646 RepID=UPI0018E84E22|nr:hypothetical protein [Alicyclobacillus sp. SO9]